MSTVTYCPEDNKLRLYVGRVPRAEYETLRAAGFTSTPKQDCDFVATWTPHREDLAREYLEDHEDIGDEDYSPEDRAADRAERFGDYRDKRANEAGASADAFDAGPAAFGHQNRARAERAARRHDRKRVYAVSQWSKAEYWQERTAGVIRHALHKSSAHVRRGRILTLEAEQRKHEAGRKEHAEMWAAWELVPTLDGAHEPLKRAESKSFLGLAAGSKLGQIAAYRLANSSGCWKQCTHPRTGETSSLYSLLTDPVDPITPAEAAALFLGSHRSPDDPESLSARWSAHYEMRLTYERAMLEAEGGSAAEVDMEPGGWIQVGSARRSRHLIAVDGWAQILRVNRSPVTKRVVSVVAHGRDPFGYADPAEGQKIREITINIQRAGDDAYRAPTEEERAAFKAETKAKKAAAKASKPKAPPLVNPTDADAEKLQAVWNAKAEADHKRRGGYGQFKLSEVCRMTQAEYSARSKGSYAKAGTADISEKLEERRTNYAGRDLCGRETVFKIRKTSSGFDMYAADRVVVITDKPQKPIPWADVEAAKDRQPTPEKLFPRMESLAEAVRLQLLPKGGTDLYQLIEDAHYVGWVYVSSSTQFGLTSEGKAAFDRWQEVTTEGGTFYETGIGYSLAAVAAARR